MLSQYDAAMRSENRVMVDSLKNAINADFKNFGYAYLEKPEEAIPNVPLTFYTFHFMVTVGGYLLLFLLLALFFVYKPDILWIFAVVFTALLIADIGIICKQISKKSQTDLDTIKD